MRLLPLWLLLMFPFVLHAQGSGGTLDFSGSGESVNLGNQVANNCRTIEMWFKPHQDILSSNTNVITLLARDFNNGNGASTHEFGFYFSPTMWANGGKLVFVRRVFSSMIYIASDASNWNANHWYHVAVVMHPVNGMTMYINGVPQQYTHSSTQAIGSLSGSVTDDVYVAQWGYFNGRYFDGEIDEIRFWEDARSESEIRDHMCKKLQGSEADLRAYYNFDGSSNTQLLDCSVNSYNGTFVGMNASNRIVSGAPVGDESVYQYAANMSAVNLQMAGSGTNVFEVNTIGVQAKGAHIYKVNSLPNSQTNLTGLVNTEYYGVFLCRQNDGFAIDYDFSGPACNSCEELFSRNDNAVMSWTNMALVQNGCSFSASNQSSVGNVYRAEYILQSSQGNIDLGADTVLCEGDVLYLKSKNGAGNLLWNTGVTADSILVTQSGLYWAELGGACSAIDSVEVEFVPAPQVDLGNAIEICLGDTVWLDASCGADGYSWSTGSSDSVIPVVQGGTYWVWAAEALCMAGDTVQVSELPMPQPVYFPDQTICEGDFIRLNVAQSNVDVLWSDGSTQLQNIFTESGDYWVEVSNTCGTEKDSFELIVEDCDCKILIPNVITPNGDGLNDFFVIKNVDCLEQAHLLIYNRWGNLVFESLKYCNNWDGANCADGTYYYIFTYRNFGQKQEAHGSITVLRKP